MIKMTQENRNICINAKFIIENRNIEEFKKLAQELCNVVEVNDADALEYQFYFSKDETRCVVFERYASSEAAIAHNNNPTIKTMLLSIFHIAQLNRLDVFGTPTEQLHHMLQEFNTHIYTRSAGFTRGFIRYT